MKKILIVDDEKNLVLSVGWGLKRFGHHVDSAESAELALPMLRYGYDMVLSDYRLPGKDGIWLLTKAREITPGASRLMMTGAEENFEAHGDLIHLLLNKPFGADEIDIIFGMLED